MKQITRIWISKEAHNQLRIEAANNKCGITEAADDILLGRKKKGGRNYENSFF
jgi:hypothetical protein